MAAARVMPTTEDDFGKTGRRKFTATWNPGACQPRHGLGATLADVRPASPATQRRTLVGLPTGCMDVGAVHVQEAISSRRHRGGVSNSHGETVHTNAPSAERMRSVGKRTFDFVPAAKKSLEDQGKRCYEWTNRPSGYENPEQWEAPSMPGQRPTHPVSSTGVVALGHRRPCPEVQHAETCSPGDPRRSRPPVNGAEFGGWAKSGAPGRGPFNGLWDSLEPNAAAAATGADVVVRLGDMRKKPFPDRDYTDAAHLTRWHLDPRADIDPVVRRQVILNVANEELSPGLVTPRAAMVRRPAAGMRTGLAKEGAALQYYDRVRDGEAAAASGGPWTAR